MPFQREDSAVITDLSGHKDLLFCLRLFLVKETGEDWEKGVARDEFRVVDGIREDTGGKEIRVIAESVESFHGQPCWMQAPPGHLTRA